MGKISLIKAGVSLVTSAGSGMIVNNIVKSTTPSNTGKIGKICIGAGGLVISSIVGDKVSEYVEDKADEFVDWIRDSIVDKTSEEIE